jgi:hypothetical protein
LAIIGTGNDFLQGDEVPSLTDLSANGVAKISYLRHLNLIQQPHH